MRKYHGSVIHCSQDPYGLIEVVETNLTRSLHFGNPVRQSAMDINRPAHLVLTYTRAMMSALLFHPSPQRVLIVGLGGGSLARFLLHFFPECHIDAVETREQVVKIAHGYFLLPETPRLHIHIADGGDFARRIAADTPAIYDLILVDAYDGNGMADAMGQLPFLGNCRRLLTRSGLLVSNLWGNDRPRYTQVRRRLEACFGAAPLLLAAEGTTNMAALSFDRPWNSRLLRQTRSRARQLEDQTGMEFVRLARALCKHNGTLLDKLFA